MAQLFQDLIEFATDVATGSTGTTLSAPGLADLVAVVSPGFVALTLDPDAENGAPEIVWVTAHTASATTATIARGKEGTAARPHPVGTKAVAALTATAFDSHAARHADGGADALPAGAVDTTQIAANAITNAKISNRTIAGNKLQLGAVDTTEIADDAIFQSKVSTGAIGANEIAADAVTNAKIAADAVDTTEIAANAVTSSELAPDAVDTGNIADNAVSSDKLTDAIMTALEVDNSTEVASHGTSSTSFENIASVTLSIPASWNSWKCEAWATYVVGGGDGDAYEARIRIDGTDQQAKAVDGLVTTSERKDGSVGGRRTGMTTTGSRSVALRMRHTSATSVNISDVYLYARAVRTS